MRDTAEVPRGTSGCCARKSNAHRTPAEAVDSKERRRVRDSMVGPLEARNTRPGSWGTKPKFEFWAVTSHLSKWS